MKFKNLNKHEQNLKNKVKDLIHLRKNSMALLFGTTQIENFDKILIIKRKYFNEEVVLVINKSSQNYFYLGNEIFPGEYKFINKKY